jgi:hypothetical protein
MADIKAMNPSHKEIAIADFKKKDGTIAKVGQNAIHAPGRAHLHERRRR